MPLLNKDDVRNLLSGYNLTDPQLDVAMRVVAGWLREATGLTELPDPVPDTHALWSPAIELVGLIAENPTSLASKTVGPTSRAWPLARRRDAIVAGVRAAYAAAAGTGSPSGSFPEAYPWPDGPVFPAGGWR